VTSYGRAYRSNPPVVADPRESAGCVVVVQAGEPIESALRRFKKAVERAGISNDLRCREFFEPWSERRRRKSAIARKRESKIRSAA
jgi:small subunit ribosomal protein S21